MRKPLAIEKARRKRKLNGTSLTKKVNNSNTHNEEKHMNNTTQFQSMEDSNQGMEIQVSEFDHCGYIGDRVIVFLIGGIGVSLVSVFGIVENILCFIVLSRPSMRTSTNIILLGLSVYDFVFVCMCFLMYGIPWTIQYFCVASFESFYLTTLKPIKVTYLDPLFAIGTLGSTYFTVLVTMERCFVVYRPLLARPYCTNRNAVRASLLTVLFTILYIMPFWWHYRLESVCDETGSWAKYRILKLLWKNEKYAQYYTNWFGLFLYRIIPLTVLTLLNISMYWKVRAANKMRESMTHSSDIALAKMLMWVVSIFLLCNLYSLVLFVSLILDSSEDQGHLELYAVSRFLFSLNSTVNFIIYSVMTKKFRRVALDLFWPKKKRGERSNNVPMNPM